MAGTEAGVPRVAGNWSCNIDSRHDIVKSSWKYRLLCCCVTRDMTQSNGLQEGSFIFLFSVSCFDEEVIFFINFFEGFFEKSKIIRSQRSVPTVAWRSTKVIKWVVWEKIRSQNQNLDHLVRGRWTAVRARSLSFPASLSWIPGVLQQQANKAWREENAFKDELQAVPGEKKERRTTRRRSIFRTMRFGAFSFRPRTSKKRLQKLEHTGLWLPGKRN